MCQSCVIEKKERRYVPKRETRAVPVRGHAKFFLGLGGSREIFSSLEGAGQGRAEPARSKFLCYAEKNGVFRLAGADRKAVTGDVESTAM